MHPASGAYGVNLQYGGHDIVWYTMPWSLELYQQANFRLNRLGQANPVIIHRIITKKTVDESGIRCRGVWNCTNRRISA